MADGKGKMMREAIMKRRTELIVIGVVALAAAVLVGLAIVSSVNRGGTDDVGTCGGGGGAACCPLILDLNVCSTNFWVQVGSTNGKAGMAASESVTNRQQ